MGIHRVSNARQSRCPCTTVQLLGRCVGSGIVGVGNRVEQSFGPGHLDQRVPGLAELSMPVLVVLGKCPGQVEENLLARSQASVSAGTVRGTGERQKYMPCHMLTGNCDSACGYAAFGTACEPYRPGMYASTAKLIPVSALGSLLTRCSIIKGRSVLDLPTPINLAPSHAPCLLSGAPA